MLHDNSLEGDPGGISGTGPSSLLASIAEALSFQQDFVTKLDALTGGPSLDNLKNTPPHTNIMSNSKDHYSFVRETAINLFSILDQAQILLTQLLSRTKNTTSSDCNNNLDNNLAMRLEASLQEVHKRLDKLESPHSS